MSQKMNEQWELELEKRASEGAAAFSSFIRVVAQLRHPEHGCPWDLKQTHQSLRKYMLEEAYEASRAMFEGDSKALKEELGDVLLQVVLNAQLLSDAGNGDLKDVVKTIEEKMIRRHPHVFDRDKQLPTDPESLQQNWAKIKASEKLPNESNSILADALKILPALSQACRIGREVKSLGFDWDSDAEVFEQCQRELNELQVEIVNKNRERQLDEMGDVFFSLAQLCRHLGIDPEAAAQQGNLKFANRFKIMEEHCRLNGLDFKNLDRSKKEALWIEAKNRALK